MGAPEAYFFNKHTGSRCRAETVLFFYIALGSGMVTFDICNKY